MKKALDSAFKKVDLHVHTPKSACYSEKSITAEQIIDAALATGLEVIAITDHNTVTAIDDIRQFAGKKGPFVFPGIELSAKEGHVIALFDLDTPVKWLEDFLDYVQVDRNGRGDAHTMAGYGMEEVFQKIDARGGIAIAAHIERWPSGLLEANEPLSVKRRIHASQYLSALEITIPENKSNWNNGAMNGYLKKYACIQGSDAHAPGEIGRRPVYIQMETINLMALRDAFLDYNARVLFPNEFHQD